MIEITMKDGRTAYVAAAHIVWVRQESEEYTTMALDNGASLTIRNKAEDIAKELAHDQQS